MHRVAVAVLSIAVASIAGAACGGGAQSEPQPDTAGYEPPVEEPPPSDIAPEPAAATEPTATAIPEPEAAPIAVGAVKVTITEKGKKAIVELTADGSVKHSKDGKVVLKFVKNAVEDVDGKWVLRVKHDGTIESRHTERVIKDGKTESEKESVETIGKFVEGDAMEGVAKRADWLLQPQPLGYWLASRTNGKMVLGDDGKVTLHKADGKLEPIKELKVEGVTPATRRAAVLLVLAVFVPSTVTTEASASSAKTPATPPKTPPTKTPPSMTPTPPTKTPAPPPQPPKK